MLQYFVMKGVVIGLYRIPQTHRTCNYLRQNSIYNICMKMLYSYNDCEALANIESKFTEACTFRHFGKKSRITIPATASRGSSIFNFAIQKHYVMNTRPATRPITNAAQG